MPENSITDNLSNSIRSEQVHIIATHAPVTNLAVILVAFLFFYLLQGKTNSVLLLSWLALIVAGGFYRLWLWHIYDHDKPNEWLIKYFSATTIIGLIWSGLFLLPVDKDNVFLVGGLLMVYFGLVSAALPSLSVYLPAYFFYTIPSTITLFITLQSFNDQVYFVLSFAILVFYSMMAVFSSNANKNTLEMIQLKINNRQLVDELEEEVLQRDKLVENKTQELRSVNHALFQSEDRLRNVINGANLGYWDWNFQSGDHEVNDRWLEILGLERDDIRNNVIDWEERVHPDDKARMQSILSRSIKEHSYYSADFRMKHKDGHWVWIQGSGAVVEYDPETNNPMRLCGTHEDISQRKELEKRLEFQATHDELTGLYNRVQLWKNLDAETGRSKRYQHDLSLFLIDIDFFKQINDKHGHKAGDLVLVEFSRILLSEVRATDITSRYGGEEFIVILPETSLKKAEELAERLRQKVAQTSIISGDNSIKITISIGVATYPQNGKNSSQLLDAADKAMYQAKQNGRNCVKSGSLLSVIS